MEISSSFMYFVAENPLATMGWKEMSRASALGFWVSKINAVLKSFSYSTFFHLLYTSADTHNILTCN